MRHAVAVAEKLELTSIALGCLTRKELCAAFLRVNPQTVMTLQNSYNWLSGRSVPRTFSLFEDWAAALRLDEGPHFVLSSSLEEFAEAVGRRVVLPAGLLESLGGASGAASAAREAVPGARPETAREPGAGAGAAGAAAMPGPSRGSVWRNGALLHGSFLALSHSWSPQQRGRLLGGALSFEVQEGGRITVDYREKILGRTVRFGGSGLEDGRTGQVTLHCEANAATYLMAFHLPPLPGNLTAGVFAGTALYDPDSEPTASGILFLRNHALEREALEAVCGYEDLDIEALTRLLDLLGYGSDPDRAAERALLTLLSPIGSGPLLALPRSDVVAAATLLDRRRLALPA